jgi:hypothetical protein
MTGPVPEKRVAGLMDVINKTEEMYYIDNGNPMETLEKNPSTQVLDEAKINPLGDEGQGSGLKETWARPRLKNPRNTHLGLHPPQLMRPNNKPRKQLELMPFWSTKVTTPFYVKTLVHFFTLLSL